MKNLIVIIVILTAGFLNLLSSEYQVDKKSKNLVRFISETPVEDFDGKTNKIDGYLISDGIDKMQGAEFYFELDLGSFDTGIGLRNRHMREDYLETKEFPFSTFKGNITETERISDTEYNVKVSGKLLLHGVTKDITIGAKIYKLSDGFKLKSDFEVKLTDYNIKVPKFMFVRISDEIKLYLDFNVKLAE